MRSNTAMACSLPLLAALGCGSPAGLDVSSIEPDVVSTRVSTPATIHGNGLRGLVDVDLDDDRPPQVDQEWIVRIGATELAPGDVEPTSSGNLSIVVPAGLPLGDHDVTVQSPGGASDTLPGALTVIDGDPNADAGPPDAGGACAVCNEAECSDGCTIDCSSGGCPDTVVCPAGVDCTVNCSGGSACPGGIDCTEASTCTVVCSSDSSCSGGIECGAGACDIDCNGDNACGPIECTDSCACEVDCSGGAACEEPAACPSGCQEDRGCTSQGTCNTCL